jgi:outer membrane protein assembly factor BamD
MPSCNDIEKIQKSKDFAYKLTKANEFYDNKKWQNANTLYEELLTVYKGTKNFEEIYYKYANTFYFLKNYLSASYHYKNFTDIFPGSPKKEECDYLTCICLYKMSPEASMDQTSTIQAIGALQTFLANYPESPKAEEANVIIDEARSKIEAKDKESAYLYHKIGQFKSAGASYANLIKKFPDSKEVDYYQYMVLLNNYNYSRLSVAEKQKERFDQCLVDYNDLITNYPNSKYKNEADKVKTLIFASLNKIKGK